MRPTILVATFAFFQCSCAMAEDAAAPAAEPVSPSTAFSRFGYSSEEAITDKTCKVSFTLDQKPFIDNVSIIRPFAFNDQTTDSDVESKPIKYMSVFSVSLASSTVKFEYEKNSSIDKCQFQGFISAIDDFGNAQKIPSLSFYFDRATFKRINWDNFPDKNLMKVSKSFVFSPDLQKMIVKESQ